MQTICTSLQKENHTDTSSLDCYRPDALSGAQSTASKHTHTHTHTHPFNGPFAGTTLCRPPTPPNINPSFGLGTLCWWRGTVVERRSLAGELSLSCARLAADG